MKTMILLVVIALLLGAYSERKNLGNMVRGPSAVYAKEYCSCLFVMEHEEAFCEGYVPSLITVDKVIDKEEKSIVATALGVDTKASLKSKRFGCSFSES